jgi:hypothetical protein
MVKAEGATEAEDLKDRENCIISYDSADLWLCDMSFCWFGQSTGKADNRVGSHRMCICNSTKSKAIIRI